MTTPLTGLSSGLDTTSLIQSMMAAASQPKTLLDQQISTQQATVGDLQKLNSALASLAQLTDQFTGTKLAAFSVSSSQASLATGTAEPTAAPGQLSFTVDQLATRQVEVTGALSSWPTNPPTLTLVAADGTQTSITPSSNSLDSVVQAINAASAGITALKVQAGTDASGNALYRLQLSSSQTGANAAFTVLDGTGADIMGQPGSAVVSTAQDAQLTLWPGTAAAQTVTSATNAFTDLMPGVDVTVAQTSTDAVTLTVGQDLDAESQTASTLVSSVQSILSGIAQGTAVTSTTDASGNTTVTFGSFTADGTVRGAARDLTDAMTLDVNGVSPSSIGFNLAKDGTISFDQDTFEAAMADDPQGTTQLYNAIAARVNAVATQLSDPYSGTLTSEITSDNSSITAMQQKSDDMQTLLDQQQATLQQQFAYMETMMSQIQSQGSYVQSYIDALTSSSSSKSK
ncbi:flagellar hook-associated protein 2 [Gryllotalpicola daejeonensis]|uniref:Flagellar hook-associated protein 2 n=1 Tax=Gryllotalpicola daejeonensis TaxID=993087 RepID=A0ABP7ZI74_9MICO